MNPREAMKEAIKFNLINIGMDADVAADVAEQMHDDSLFLEELEQFFKDHINDFGDNYGLYVAVRKKAHETQKQREVIR